MMNQNEVKTTLAGKGASVGPADSDDLAPIVEQRRLRAPAPTPQALAWHDGSLWIGSRDLRRVYRVDPASGAAREELDAPGIPWAAVSTGDELRFTLGEGAEDDRWIWRFVPGRGFLDEGRLACPEMTGSYLSYDGERLYLSQWYKHRILALDRNGEIVRTIDVGAEICGHTFVGRDLYVLRGTEQNGERWTIARIDPRQAVPQVQDLARVPFAARSLGYDGAAFWSNHRAADTTISFTLPR